MAQQGKDFVFSSTKGGLNDTDSPNNLPEDMVTQAMNVEWFYSDLGERRAGCDQLDALSGSGFTSSMTIVYLTQWYPTHDPLQPELFAIAGVPGSSATVIQMARRTGSGTGTPQWYNVPTTTFGLNHSPAASDPIIYNMQSQALNGKLFFAYLSIGASLDRLHVWDGSNLRPTGIAQPPTAPTAVDTFSGLFLFSTTRYYRVRFIRIAPDGTIRGRSEPSVTLTFTPAATSMGAIITAPAGVNEGETHWELEESIDNANFYRVLTTPIGSTATDDLDVTSVKNGVLSEAINAYLLQPAAKYMATDDDRLILAGHQFDATRKSRVWWSPRLQDPGVGNDERQPSVDTGGALITTFADFDEYEGGEITGVSPPINGSPYLFKWGAIGKMVRTQDATRAYDIVTISKTTGNSAGRGAVPGSVIQGVDMNGAACVYFLDPLHGPSLVNGGGIQSINNIWTTFRRVNLKAAVICRGLFYPFKKQLWWFCAADGSNLPALGIKIQTTELKTDTRRGGLWGGVSLFNGTLATATAVGLYSEWVINNGSANFETRPFVALPGADFGIYRCDVNTTDNGHAYTAQITTKPMMLAGLLDKFGCRELALMGTALAGSSIVVKFNRDFGVEISASKTVSLAPVGTETYVLPIVDDMVMSEARAIQVQYGDS